MMKEAGSPEKVVPASNTQKHHNAKAQGPTDSPEET
jgi:hypothetical protein